MATPRENTNGNNSIPWPFLLFSHLIMIMCCRLNAILIAIFAYDKNDLVHVDYSANAAIKFHLIFVFYFKLTKLGSDLFPKVSIYNLLPEYNNSNAI